MAGDAAAGASPEVQVQMRDVVRFVRQLSHDIRNHLNAAELQSAFIGEIAESAELKGEIKRLRGMLAEAASGLQKLSATIAEVKLNPMEYSASDFVEDVRQKIARDMPGLELQWEVDVDSGATFNIDPQALQQGISELFDNAARHGRGEGPIAATATVDDSALVLRLREPKSKFDAETRNWGAEPFRSIGQNHYGLGLHRVRRIIEAHRGTFAAEYDAGSSSLTTTIRLPLDRKSG